MSSGEGMNRRTATSEPVSSEKGRRGVYRYSRWTGEDVIRMATAAPPQGPGLMAEAAVQADVLEVWATDLTDPEDFTEWRLMEDGRVTARHHIPGY